MRLCGVICLYIIFATDCVEQQNVYHVINVSANEAEQDSLETDDTCRVHSISSFLELISYFHNSGAYVVLYCSV